MKCTEWVYIYQLGQWEFYTNVMEMSRFYVFLECRSDSLLLFSELLNWYDSNENGTKPYVLLFDAIHWRQLSKSVKRCVTTWLTGMWSGVVQSLWVHASSLSASRGGLTLYTLWPGETPDWSPNYIKIKKIYTRRDIFIWHCATEWKHQAGGGVKRFSG